MTPGTLSLPAAILISINIMIGSGLFINTVLLAQNAGTASPLVYGLIGVLIFPLIASFFQLLKYHPGGSFYDFARSISKYAGFLSQWSYFNIKMASATLAIHVFVSMIRQIIPIFAPINPVFFDITIITLFIFLNSLNMRIGKKIQYSFVAMKMIPIGFCVMAGLILFNIDNISTPISWSGVATSIPFALYALTGFEAICSIGRTLENPEKNGPLAILISFCSVLCIVILYQFMFCASLGKELGSLSSYLDAFPALTQKLFIDPKTQFIVQKILNLGIAASALGVAYGIIYSNSWNLYTLSKRNLVLGSRYFTLLNKHHVPLGAILIEGILAYTYILITQGNQVPLQQLNTIGLTLTYILSCAGLISVTWKNEKRINKIGFLGLMSCFVLTFFQIQNFIIYGFTYLILFLIIMVAGTLMYILRRSKHHHLTDFQR